MVVLPADGPVRLAPAVQADPVVPVRVDLVVQADQAGPVDQAGRPAAVLTVRPADSVRRGRLVHKQISCLPKCVLGIAR